MYDTKHTDTKESKWLRHFWCRRCQGSKQQQKHKRKLEFDYITNSRVTTRIHESPTTRYDMMWRSINVC